VASTYVPTYLPTSALIRIPINLPPQWLWISPDNHDYKGRKSYQISYHNLSADAHKILSYNGSKDGVSSVPG